MLARSASRALALRFLARQWGVPLDKVLVVASQRGEPDGDRAALLDGLVSSMLVGGAPPPSPRTAVRSEAPPMSVSADDMAVAAAHVVRTAWLNDGDNVEAALVTALAAKEE